MTDNSKKVSELPVANNIAPTDRVMYLKDPSGVPSVRTITVNNFISNVASYIITLAAANSQPAAANAYTNAVSYVNTTLDTRLAAYVNTTNLSSNLSNYVTTANLISTLNNYTNSTQLTANISNFINSVSLSNTLTVYVNTSQLSANLSNYSTVNNIISNSATAYTNAVSYVDSKAYVNTAQFIANLDNYVLESEFVNVVNFVGTVRPTMLIETQTFTANSLNEIILVDPNAAGGRVTVNFPNTAANGKIYTVKNINGSNSVRVAITGSPNNIESHNLGVMGNYDDLPSSGNTVTWVFYNGYYRVLNFN